MPFHPAAPSAPRAAWQRSRRYATNDTSTHLSHRGKNARDVLWARQAVIAVLDHGEDDVVGRQAVRQCEGVLPRHVGILRALENSHRTAEIDGAAEHQVIAPLLDQVPRDRIGRAVAILGRPEPEAFGLDLLL